MILSLLSVCACIHSIPVEGVSLDEETWRPSEVKIRNRAAFDLKCDAQALKLTVLNTDSSGNFPSQVGVHGCDQWAVSVCSGSGGWVVNTLTDRHPAQ